MGNMALAMVGLGVFTLLVAGLVLTMIEFHRVADRPDLVRGANVGAARQTDETRAGARGV